VLTGEFNSPFILKKCLNFLLKKCFKFLGIYFNANYMPVLAQGKNLLCFFNLLYLKEIDAVQRGGFFGKKR